MDPIQTRATIGDLTRQRATLDTRRQELSAALEQEQRADHYSPGQVRELKTELTRVVERIEEVDARRRALDATLPSPEKVSSAQAELNELSETAVQTTAAFRSAEKALVAALQQAETLALALASARTECKQALDHSVDVARQAGLAFAPAAVPVVALAAVAALQALLIQQALFGEPESVVLINLASEKVQAGLPAGHYQVT